MKKTKSKKFKQQMLAINKVTAQNLKSRRSARQFLQTAGIKLREQSQHSNWMTVISTCSADGWMIISSGGWD